ncbi:hypothetical protein Tco_1306971 [Tanacetum coccineum]
MRGYLLLTPVVKLFDHGSQYINVLFINAGEGPPWTCLAGADVPPEGVLLVPDFVFGVKVVSMLQVLAADQMSVSFVHRTSIISVLALIGTILYLLHRYYSLFPKETCCSLPLEETCCSLPPEETGCSLPLEETDCSLPPEETCCSLPHEETGFSVRLKETGCSLTHEEACCSLPPEENGCSLPPEETGCSLTHEEACCSLPPEENGCSLPPEETCCSLPPKEIGCSLPLEETYYSLPHEETQLLSYCLWTWGGLRHPSYSSGLFQHGVVLF